MTVSNSVFICVIANVPVFVFVCVRVSVSVSFCVLNCTFGLRSKMAVWLKIELGETWLN